MKARCLYSLIIAVLFSTSDCKAWNTNIWPAVQHPHYTDGWPREVYSSIFERVDAVWNGHDYASISFGHFADHGLWSELSELELNGLSDDVKMFERVGQFIPGYTGSEVNVRATFPFWSSYYAHPFTNSTPLFVSTNNVQLLSLYKSEFGNIRSLVTNCLFGLGNKYGVEYDIFGHPYSVSVDGYDMLFNNDMIGWLASVRFGAFLDYGAYNWTNGYNDEPDIRSYLAYLNPLIDDRDKYLYYDRDGGGDFMGGIPAGGWLTHTTYEKETLLELLGFATTGNTWDIVPGSPHATASETNDAAFIKSKLKVWDKLHEVVRGLGTYALAPVIFVKYSMVGYDDALIETADGLITDPNAGKLYWNDAASAIPMNTWYTIEPWHGRPVERQFNSASPPGSPGASSSADNGLYVPVIQPMRNGWNYDTYGHELRTYASIGTMGSAPDFDASDLDPENINQLCFILDLNKLNGDLPPNAASPVTTEIYIGCYHCEMSSPGIRMDDGTNAPSASYTATKTSESWGDLLHVSATLYQGNTAQNREDVLTGVVKLTFSNAWQIGTFDYN